VEQSGSAVGRQSRAIISDFLVSLTGIETLLTLRLVKLKLELKRSVRPNLGDR
jgi:hypothetical protein